MIEILNEAPEQLEQQEPEVLKLQEFGLGFRV